VSGVVTWITYAPVKGLGLVSVDGVELEENGVRGNRRFHLIGEDGRLVNGKFAGQLVQIRASSDPDGRVLELVLPDGSTVAGEVETGEPVATDFYGNPVAGHVVRGAFAEAISSLAGRPLRLVRVDEAGAGNDRGAAGSVSVVSQGALDLLAREAGVPDVDGRRFRMLFGIDGVEAHAEDGWLGRRVAVGDAVVAVRGLVGRCAVTTQNPDTGIKDLDTLRTIRRYRPEVEGEEPLPIGVWGGVEQPGRVRVGDTVAPL
jgi:uncharacterized protein YcbX